MARLTARLNAAAGRRLEAKSVTGEDNRTNANATLTPGQYNATAPGRALSPRASAQIQCRVCHCLASWRESTPTPDGSMTTLWRPGPANRRCNWPPPKPPRPSHRLVPGSHRLPLRWQSRPTAPAPGGFMTTWWRPGPANRHCSWPPGEPAGSGCRLVRSRSQTTRVAAGVPMSGSTPCCAANWRRDTIRRTWPPHAATGARRGGSETTAAWRMHCPSQTSARSDEHRDARTGQSRPGGVLACGHARPAEPLAGNHRSWPAAATARQVTGTVRQRCSW